MAPARDAFVLPGTYIDPTCPINWEHPLTDGLVCMIRAVANPGWSGGITVRDLVRGERSPHDGTINGTVGTNVSWQGPKGRRGGAGSLLLDGSSGYISCGTSAALQPPAASALIWVYGNSFGNAYNACLSARSTSPAGWGQLFVKSNSKLAVYVYNSSNGTIDYDGTGSFTLSTGKWYHLAFTYDSVAGLKGYVNGQLDGTAAPNSPLGTGNGAFTLGTDTVTAGRLFAGLVDEMALYNRALTAQEITALYKSSIAGHPELLNYLGTKDYGFASAVSNPPIGRIIKKTHCAVSDAASW